MTFENANSKCKGVTSPLLTELVSIAEWIKNTPDIRSLTDANTWIGEVVCKNFQKNQNIRCLNCINQEI